VDEVQVDVVEAEPLKGAAVSRERYPALRALLTACSVSSSGTWKTPKPRTGISTPLFRVTVCMVRFLPISSGAGSGVVTLPVHRRVRA
jgi:hypothetical protein